MWSLRQLSLAHVQAQLELHGQADSMPSNCCTIVTWSCAVLRFFRPSLFTVLARVAARDLQAQREKTAQRAPCTALQLA